MILKKLNAALKLFKIDLRGFGHSLSEMPRYFSDRSKFLKLTSTDLWPLKYYPVLLDRKAHSASLGEYFWQDLFVAKQIIQENPERHVDVGSRVDGFIAHLACVRDVEVFDIRPLSADIDNVSFVQWDVTNPNSEYFGVSDCVSCLHTIEHIGLGRYGDKLDPNGWSKGMQSLAALLAPEGLLWLSVPIGQQRVEFNAHRVFNPATIINEANKYSLELEKLFYLGDTGIHQSANIYDDIKTLSQKYYGLGLFLFRKQ